MGAYNFIIAIDDIRNLIVATIFMNRIVNVLQSSFSFMVFDKDHFFLRNFTPFEILGYLIGSVVSRSVINNYKSIVGVLLLQNGLQVPNIPIILDIVKGGNDYASMKLFIKALNMIFVLVVPFLSLMDDL